MPLVSVIMPVYNVEAYVADAVRSVLRQTFKDFELIIVDDAGNDRSMTICESFWDERIRIARQNNRGLAGARNTGIRYARGKYLAFLDSDDLWHPEKLARHVAHLESKPAVGISYCPSAFINDAGEALGYLQNPKLTDISAADVFLRNPIGNGSVPVIRREVFRQIRFVDLKNGRSWTQYFDENLRQSEDIECWTRIALKTGWEFEGIAEPLTSYRVNDSGLSANVEKQLASWECFVNRTRTYAPEFVAHWESLARAFQLRYLARRAIRSGDPVAALRLVAAALRSSPDLLLREPGRTLTTFASTLTQLLLPPRYFRHIMGWAMRIAGRWQRPNAAGDLIRNLRSANAQ